MAKKYKASWLHEVKRFEGISPGPPANETGLKQFFQFESRGIRPEHPDGYFVRLLNGKRWWEWNVNEYASLYDTWEWPGFFQLEIDFANDAAGLQQIRDRCKRRRQAA